MWYWGYCDFILVLIGWLFGVEVVIMKVIWSEYFCWYIDFVVEILGFEVLGLWGFGNGGVWLVLEVGMLNFLVCWMDELFYVWVVMIYVGSL